MLTYKYSTEHNVNQGFMFINRKTNKFGSRITTYNGVKYHSKAEAKYAQILDNLLEQRLINKYVRQVRYPLPNTDGNMRMAYIADFVVTGNSGEEYIIDVKGVLTAENKTKLAYFRYYYKKRVWIVFTKGPESFRTRFLV